MIKITADSTADLDHIFKEKDIPVMPLFVTLDGETYRDGVTIQPEVIYGTYEEKRVLPKTAAVGMEEYAEFFKKHSEGGNEVIHFCISAELSTSYSNAFLASKEFDNIFVVDSRMLSSGIGLLVLKAIEYRESGKTAKEIFDIVTELAPHVQTSFMVNTLDFLHKGGRCSALTAIVGGILKVRPVLQLVNGKIEVARKYLGSYSKNMIKYVESTLKTYDTPDYTRIFITHTNAEAELLAEVEAEIRRNAPQFREILFTKAGCTVASHCGKGTLGILYINKAD